MREFSTQGPYMFFHDSFNRYRRFRSMFNRGRIEGEFNSHRTGSGIEELIEYMMELDDIGMN